MTNPPNLPLYARFLRLKTHRARQYAYVRRKRIFVFICLTMLISQKEIVWEINADTGEAPLAQTTAVKTSSAWDDLSIVKRDEGTPVFINKAKPAEKSKPSVWEEYAAPKPAITSPARKASPATAPAVSKKKKPAAKKKTPARKTAPVSRRRAQLDYTDRYARTAQTEMKAYGVPASITLARALLESDAGNNRAAREHNNHLGLRCTKKSCAADHCALLWMDGKKGIYRKFGSIWESYRAHGKQLRGKAYRKLRKTDPNDYQAWARGLQKIEFPNDPSYADRLIKIIEDLDLFLYDGI